MLVVLVLLVLMAVVGKRLASGESVASLMGRSGEIVNPYPPGSPLHAQPPDHAEQVARMMWGGE